MTEELSNSNPNKLSELNKVEGDSTGSNQEGPVFENTEPTEEEKQAQLLENLRGRCRVLGISYSPNTKDPAVLSAKIAAHNAALEAKSNGANEEIASAEYNNDDDDVVEPVKALPKARVKSVAQAMKEENMRLIRVRITCMDPKKKDLPGEIVTFGNRFIGTVRKFIPFGEATDNGYHVPYVLLKQLRKRTFNSISSSTVNGRIVVKTRDVREFSIDELPPLTPEELARLGAQQAAAMGLE